jgi:Sulfotransferase family
MNVLLPRATGIVLDKWKVIYVITPKLMGTSMLWMMAELQNEDPARFVAHCRAPEVTRALAVHDPAIWQQWSKPLHLLPADVIEQVTGDDGWFRLAWTRHPVDRLWSAWQSKLLLREPLFVELYGRAQWFPRNPKELPKGAAALGAIAEDFERFVAALAQDPQLLTADPHWAPQSYLLRPEAFPYSEIGRIESGAVTLGKLERHLQAQGWQGTLDLKRLNATLLPRAVIHDPTLLRQIEKIYTDDMIAFGYEPANVGHPPSADASAVAVQALAELVERHERIGDLHQMLAPEYYPGAPGGSPEVEQQKVNSPNEEGRDRRTAVEISGVTPCPSDDLITAAWLDYPRTGPIDGYAFEVFGWVVSKAPVAEVQFIHDGIVIASCELTVSRPDVASAHGSSSPVGFWKAIGTVGLAPAFTIEVWAVFQDGRRREIAEIRGTQQLTSAFTPSMQPIMVTSPGQSGSTLLMRILAEHPDIIVEERFPYETYVFSYWMHFMHVLAAPADTSPMESHEFWRDPNRLSPFPYFFKDPAIGLIPPEEATLDRWYASDQVEEFARVAQAAVESFYREYASTRKRTTPAFFAEEMVPAGHIRPIMRLLYPRAREVFLVRDPRDTVASVLEFHARHGVAGGFGAQSVGTDEQLVGLVRESILSLTHLWKRRSQYDALVRYEDLVRSPTGQIRAMLDAMELDSSANIVDSMVKAGNEVTADVNAHRTSPDGPSSIGRWKRDLEPRLQKICDEAFDGLLDELGGSSY